MNKSYRFQQNSHEKFAVLTSPRPFGSLAAILAQVISDPIGEWSLLAKQVIRDEGQVYDE